MKSTEIIEAIRQKLTVPGGRHLYGVLGTYNQLNGFAKKLRQAKTTDGDPFPKPVNVNRGILDAMPDNEFKQLAENEAKRPEPTAAHVARAFERFLRAKLTGKGILVLSNLEMLFACHIELNLLAFPGFQIRACEGYDPESKRKVEEMAALSEMSL